MKYGSASSEGSARRGPRRGRGRPRQGEEVRTTTEDRQRIAAWFAGRLPTGWYEEAPGIQVDDDEILVVGTLPAPTLAKGAGDDERATAAGARISGFREDTRDQRMRIAEEAQAAFGRHVSWGARCDDTAVDFTVASVPVMTRLRLRERQVLDTLIDAGVARSRSEALAWCVRLVGKNEASWIGDLRAAFEQVDEVRSRGPHSAPT